MHEVFFISLDIGWILNRKKSGYLEMKVRDTMVSHFYGLPGSFKYSNSSITRQA